MTNTRTYGTWTPVKTIGSYSGLARFYSEVQDRATGDVTPVGQIARVPEIPSPYSYSSTWDVYAWGGRRVFVRETAHRRYDVFEVPAGTKLLPVEC